jgi:hypothetical protein
MRKIFVSLILILVMCGFVELEEDLHIFSSHDECLVDRIKRFFN